VKQKIKIILADSKDLITEGLKIFFSNYADDMTIIGIAKDGREIINIVDKEIPDIIIMDVLTPEIDGAEAVRIIKRKYPDIKIVTISTHDNITQQENNNKNEIQNTDSTETSSWLKSLTKREREIFTLLADGYDNKQIAGKLFLTLQTVKNHVSAIYSKLGVKDRLEMIVRLAKLR
jgi:DNA-binding NarL/FixJ family response regulator